MALSTAEATGYAAVVRDEVRLTIQKIEEAATQECDIEEFWSAAHLRQTADAWRALIGEQPKWDCYDRRNR